LQDETVSTLPPFNYLAPDQSAEESLECEGSLAWLDWSEGVLTMAGNHLAAALPAIR
jgi:hypothetical protein